MIKDIIFDWGGVLGPANNAIAAKELALQYGIDEEDLRNTLEDEEEKYFTVKEAAPYYKTISKKYNISAQAVEKFLDLVPAGEVFSLAKKLSLENFRVHILSNQITPRTNAIRENNDLGFFTEVVFSNEIGLCKPSTEIFEYILKEIGRTAKECVFIDDSVKNIKAAFDLGFHTIVANNIPQIKSELRKIVAF
jgi:putative hydrolase of the HAD superfamily